MAVTLGLGNRICNRLTRSSVPNHLINVVVKCKKRVATLLVLLTQGLDECDGQ